MLTVLFKTKKYFSIFHPPSGQLLFYLLAFSSAPDFLRVLLLVFLSLTPWILQLLLLALALWLAFLCPFHFAPRFLTSILPSFLCPLPRWLHFLTYSVLHFITLCFLMSPLPAPLFKPPPPHPTVTVASPFRWLCSLSPHVIAAMSRTGTRYPVPSVLSSPHYSLYLSQPHVSCAQIFLDLFTFSGVILKSPRPLLLFSPMIHPDWYIHIPWKPITACTTFCIMMLAPIPRILTLEMALTGCPETSVNNYQHTLRDNPEERRPRCLS